MTAAALMELAGELQQLTAEGQPFSQAPPITPQYLVHLQEQGLWPVGHTLAGIEVWTSVQIREALGLLIHMSGRISPDVKYGLKEPQ